MGYDDIVTSKEELRAAISSVREMLSVYDGTPLPKKVKVEYANIRASITEGYLNTKRCTRLAKLIKECSPELEELEELEEAI